MTDFVFKCCWFSGSDMVLLLIITDEVVTVNVFSELMSSAMQNNEFKERSWQEVILLALIECLVIQIGPKGP